MKTIKTADVKGCQERQNSIAEKTSHRSPITNIDYGRLVWGKIPGHKQWPAAVVKPDDCGMEIEQNKAIIFWFADNRVSLVPLRNILDFAENFRNQYESTKSKLYRTAILECLQEFRQLSGLEALTSKESLIQWAHDGFPNSVDFELRRDVVLSTKVMAMLKRIKKIHLRMCNSSSSSDFSSLSTSSSSSLNLDLSSTDGEGNWKDKVSLLMAVRDGEYDIETICIACDSTDCEVVFPHPYFEGGTCRESKEDIEDIGRLLGGDGINMCCSVCGNGGDVFLCDAPQCKRVFCIRCVELLVSPEAVQHIFQSDPWNCFLCEPYNPDTHGLIKPRPGWEEKEADQFEGCHPSIDSCVEDDTPEASSFSNRPLRVLSLFDGIGTGMYVLDQLNLEVEVYYASEINECAMNVSTLNFGSRISFIGDIQTITDKQIAQRCPIDLLIGGSPCNDLSCVNPKRKGLFDPAGTGILFFHFYRALKIIQAHNEKTHLFWLFENVVHMDQEFKTQISLFLQRKPIQIDAKYFSPQIRPRNFWGNLPEMHRPIPHHMEKVHYLKRYLSKIGKREASVKKINCVTTNPASLKLGDRRGWPVRMNDHGDVPWATEIEKIFGFPIHYTDVGNLTPHKRQVLLGRAWSVPVIKHILQPLTKYFPPKQESLLRTNCSMEKEQNLDSQTKSKGGVEMQILENTLDANHDATTSVLCSSPESPSVHVRNIEMPTHPSNDESQRSQSLVSGRMTADASVEDGVLHENDLEECTTLTAHTFYGENSKEQSITLESDKNITKINECHKDQEDINVKDRELRSRIITRSMSKLRSRMSTKSKRTLRSRMSTKSIIELRSRMSTRSE